MGWIYDLKHSLNWFLAVLVGLVSAMSLIKVTVFVFDVGLIPLLERFVDFYKNLLMPLYDLIALIPFPFTVPEWTIDLLVVYLIGVSICYRLILAMMKGFFEMEWEDSGPFKLKRRLEGPLLVSAFRLTFQPLMMLGMVFIIYNVIFDEDHTGKYETAKSTVRRALLSIALIPIAIIVFFAYNAFG